jgi:hypothetical protein
MKMAFAFTMAVSVMAIAPEFAQARGMGGARPGGGGGGYRGGGGMQRGGGMERGGESGGGNRGQYGQGAVVVVETTASTDRRAVPVITADRLVSTAADRVRERGLTPVVMATAVAAPITADRTVPLVPITQEPMAVEHTWRSRSGGSGGRRANTGGCRYLRCIAIRPADRRRLRSMTSSVTHFEIYGEEPAALADSYREALGWTVEQMAGVNYFRIQTGATEGPGIAWRADLPGDT